MHYVNYYKNGLSAIPVNLLMTTFIKIYYFCYLVWKITIDLEIKTNCSDVTRMTYCFLFLGKNVTFWVRSAAVFKI